MKTDSELLDELEKEIGWRLPRMSMREGLPHLSAPPRNEGAKIGEGIIFPPQLEDFDPDPHEQKTLVVHRFQLSKSSFLSFTGDSLTTCFGAALNEKEQVVSLALTGLKLKKIPAPVWKLDHLEYLGLFDNRLYEIPNALRSHSSVSFVAITGNAIKVIPPWVLEEGFIPQVTSDMPPIQQKTLILEGNPLRSPPPEIVERGLEAMRAYFASIESGSRPLNEAKILLVGDGGAGKTSLVRRLLGKKFNPAESQTHGINIDPWKMIIGARDIQLHMWDFGGQEIMHATHQFFLSERSLYILVLDGRKDEDPEYWLKHIESFGGDSPILIVLNKMDEHHAYDVNRRFLQRKYKGIVGFYPISCKSRAGLSELKEGLGEGLEKVDIIQTTWPVKWFEIKDKLEGMTSPFISLDEYEALCIDADIDAKEIQENLVQFLHDLGVVVHFREFNLRNMHILDPKWLTGAVYQIINAPILAKRKGILDLSSLPDLLKKKKGGFKYPSETHAYIVEIMKKFELCYAIDEDTVLIPDLLDIQEPDFEFDFESAVQFRLDYDFLPKSIIPRFIVKKNKDISGELRWRTGVVLANDDFKSTAVVRSDVNAKRVHIYVTGTERRDYLTVLRATFLEINQGFEKLQVKERVCMPDDPEVTATFEHLTRLLNEGEEEVYPDGASHSYKIQGLLGIVNVSKKRSEEAFIDLLRKAMIKGESRETTLARANRIISLKPNFFGLGGDLNALIDLALRKRAKNKKKKPPKKRK